MTGPVQLDQMRGGCWLERSPHTRFVAYGHRRSTLVIDMSLSQPSSSPDTVFHGTTASRAASIQDQGFQGPAIESELRQLADLNQVDFETLWDLLQAESFLGVSQDPDSVVCFSTDKETAKSYSLRGPEYLYYGLSFIHRLQHPGFDEEFPKWWNSDDLMWWLFRNQLTDQPVVLTVLFPEGSIPWQPKRKIPPEIADRLAALGVDLDLPGNADGQDLDKNRVVGNPLDIQMPLPVTDATVTLIETVPILIDVYLARFVAGFPRLEYGVVDQFAREVDADRFGPLIGLSHTPYFEWDDFKTRIPAERLAELMTPDGQGVSIRKPPE